MYPEGGFIMKYYEILENGKIKCILCRHYCQLKEGQVGICGVNKNENKKLKNLVYSHPSALNTDPVEKKPLYHFLPGSLALSLGTVGCNFACPFCQNWGISQSKKIDKSISITPSQMVELAKKHKCKSIAYTYNEPTVFYPYARDIGILAKEQGIKNIFVSNGFESPQIIKDMHLWLDGANIDLKSWNEKYYKNILKGGLEAVKDTLRRMVEENIWVEVTTLLIEGENDSQKELEEMATFIAEDLGRHVPWHLSAFHPDFRLSGVSPDIQTPPPSDTLPSSSAPKPSRYRSLYPRHPCRVKLSDQPLWHTLCLQKNLLRHIRRRTTLCRSLLCRKKYTCCSRSSHLRYMLPQQALCRLYWRDSISSAFQDSSFLTFRCCTHTV